ncbi:hypothetical protein TNIN_31021 [Trichonephila inaurata madagascariensis]|uniref:Uncharacterized protein n=1 Tax=Trichonephila inaurata madagascariensis TaxID=2747483 RepID=A0A8X7CL53_9ARAC|nr:hypothetical protein TNIN_31021 [Trichonephila inaurata madagascariensis]
MDNIYELNYADRNAIHHCMCELFKPQAMEWFPEHIISGEESIALLILNQPLQKECEEDLEISFVCCCCRWWCKCIKRAFWEKNYFYT